MTTTLPPFLWRWFMITLVLLFGHTGQHRAYGNPTTTTATVSQGTASFSNPSSSQLTITTSANAFINWQSFNIGAGETTTFIQPSSSSVVWNQINDPNPSQILGTLNANGYVVLQNQSGFYIGGSAAINTHGLVMTTAPSTMPNLSGGGAWQFNAPPPTAQIINYGQINIAGGGSAFLIASDIENRNDSTGTGTISAPGGKIGLYAGQQVLVSTSPDGRGLSAQVTLPQGSVDNAGNLVADAGSIIAQAKTVNQGGLIQADSVQNINGVIELLASDSLTLGASSDIEAHGDNTSANASPGGFVVLKSDNTFADNAGSKINVARGTGTGGGQGGIVEIFGNNLLNASSIKSSIGNNYAVLINPYDITLSANATDTSSSNPKLNVNDLAAYSQIALFAKDNIELNTAWSLIDPGTSASLSLQAGNNLILDGGTGLNCDNNWSVNLVAGTGFVPTVGQPLPSSGSDGIYLNGSAYIQTQNGNINLWAANEVQVGWSGIAHPVVNTGAGSITTANDGYISVMTLYGDVNTGSNPSGYLYKPPTTIRVGGIIITILLPPYYSVSTSLGGISTAAGGNVTINAGGNVISYLPSGTETDDAGTGAFGSQPGNVTITAGGNVYGHYVLANGVGTITAGQNVGVLSGGFALGLIAGSWNVNAPNGNIYLQEVRNPNGVFNNTGNDGSVAAHLFDYDPQASVTLDAGIGVYLTDENLPRLSAADQVPVIYPPILNIIAGSGGVTLQDNITLFPSEYQNLNISTTGSFVSAPNTPNATPELLMSDSSQTQWVNGGNAFSDKDNSTGLPVQAGNPNPVILNISDNMVNLDLITSKATQIKIGGNMVDCGFSGQNLSPSDVTSITVAGQIYNRSPYDFFNGSINIPSVPIADLLPGMGISWDNIFTLAINPVALASLTIPANLSPSELAAYIIENCSWFQTQRQPNGQYLGSNPGFVYNSATGRLGFTGQLTSDDLSALTGSISLLRLVNGVPVLNTATGKYETDTYSWVDSSIISTLYQASISPSSIEALVGLNSPGTDQHGYRLGGPGQFDINAGSISLGNSYGILSCGVADPQGGFNRYADLAAVTPSGGATVNVTVAGDLDMLTSTIAAIGGGDVNVTCGGSMDLGSEELFNTKRQVGFGIFTSGNDANVNVTAVGNIDIDGSRIATFNGGNIFIESLTGDVNAGNGGATANGVSVSYVDPVTGLAGYYNEDVYGNGILANTLVDPSQVPDSAIIPGNITVKTPRGSIYASLGGIVQEALNGNISGGPIINLVAGTPGTPGYPGNINLGDSGVIGGTVNVTANGNITGLVISRQSSTVNAAQNFNGTVLSGGSASVTGGGTVSGTIIGIGGASVSGGSVTAEVLGQNVSVNGGASQSTLGTTATASTAAQSAAQQSGNDSKQLANNDSGSDDDKKHKPKPALSRHIKRVTVILPKES